MLNQLKNICGEDIGAVVERIGEVAQTEGLNAYLVGGPVRDTILGRPTADIDIMLEADAGEFVRLLHQRWREIFPDLPQPKKPVLFKRYLTAKLQFPEPIAGMLSGVDFSSARREHYPVSGQAPVVEAGSLETDLSRRDFSANALALALSGDARGKVIDHHAGEQDIAQQELKVLHPKSFEDDPARLIRAARFASRLKFSLSPETEELYREAVAKDFLKRLPKFRLFDELRKALSEQDSFGAVEELEQTGLLKSLDPRLQLSEAFKRLAQGEMPEAEDAPELWMLRFVLLADSLNDAQFEELLRDFEVTKKTAEKLIAARRRRQEYAR